ncbi:hypothetical protein, partial [Citrobacter koseri]|uniref:hypothetical protein n=1 Tax=Citrobacter koseri TaxID=545 RepID=UPI001952FAAB
MEVGDYNASNWVSLIARSPAFAAFEMDPLNSLNAKKFYLDVPASIVVPTGVTTMSVKAWGAGGNGGDGSSG